ncbi:MAG: hypothetical protein LBD04_09010 [Synergistaceae bacterium]|jgi:outer membrane protein OmpA-like peptidoglycan-associated protein|nr:hypothetical protein [Synergistaceae bacterium]
MFRKLISAFAAFLAFLTILTAWPALAAPAKDHPLFRRPCGYAIAGCSRTERALTLPLAEGSITLSGPTTEVFYRSKARVPLSTSELGQRFLASLRKAGGEAVFVEDPALGGRRAVGKFVRPGRDVWVAQEVTSPREYSLTWVEVPNKLITAAPPPVSNDLYETEAQVLDLLHVVDRLGVLDFPVRFTSGASVPAKGYEKNFKKFAMLMEKDPSLKFHIAVYPDSGMKPAAQRLLLRERAAVLFNALTDLGADAKRLTTELPEGTELPFAPRGFVRLTSISAR